MKRSRFKQLNANIGTPTRENQVSPRPMKTEFRQVTHGKRVIKPIPYFGYIYRTVFASYIADYESISNATWSTGTTGGTNNFNCFYFHQTVTNQRTSTGEWILNPIRWSVDNSEVAGSNYDHWEDIGDTVSGFSSDNRLQWRPQKTPSNQLYNTVGSGAIAHSSTWMTTNSHCDFGQNIGRLMFVPFIQQGQTNRGSPSAWIESALQSIASSTPIMQNLPSCVVVDIARLNFRVNGTVSSTFYENLPHLTLPNTTIIDSVSKGDTIDIDVWYRIKKKPLAFNPTTAGKFVYYIQTTRVSNGSRRMWPYPGDNGLTNIDYGGTIPLVVFSNIDMSPSFNRDQQTYNVTIAGHSGWTLKDGSNGPHKIASAGGWLKESGLGFLKWTAPAGNAYVQAIELRYDSEIPRIVFTLGSTLRTTIGTDYLFYRPTNTGDYSTNSVSKEYGNVNHAPSGVFNQAGTTTFDLVTWSQLPRIPVGFNNSYPFDARRSGGFLPVFMEVPTTITLTRTDV